jgi:hypothetical protein
MSHQLWGIYFTILHWNLGFLEKMAMAIHHFQMITINIFESSCKHNMCEGFATCECVTHWT